MISQAILFTVSFMYVVVVVTDPMYGPQRRYFQACLTSSSIWVQRTIYALYQTYRSECSQFIGFILCYPTAFVCDCCFLRLGRQDIDVLYHENCTCGNEATNEKVQYCFHCICSYIETEITDNQVTRPSCMTTRQCVLDDRLVRKRLSLQAVAILDRNQIIEAAAAATATATSATRTATRSTDKTSSTTSLGGSEKLWHCPYPDCSYMGFISTATSPQPERLSMWQSLGRMWSSKTPEQYDPRRVRCPHCQFSSCQFCSRFWSRGTVDHTGLTCQAYAKQADIVSANNNALLEVWKARAGVQTCRRCQATIEKNDGCKHMTCRCGYEFCWKCGVDWTRGHMTANCQRTATAATTNGRIPIADHGNGLLTWMMNWWRT